MRPIFVSLLALWILQGTVLRAETADEEKKRQFLKAREEMHTVPMTPSSDSAPKPKPKPKNGSGRISITNLRLSGD